MLCAIRLAAIARVREAIGPPGAPSETEIAKPVDAGLRSLHKWLGRRGEARAKITWRKIYVGS
jgi:hypothetical protein